MYTPPRAMLIALDSFMRSVEIKDAIFDRLSGTISYWVCVPNSSDTRPSTMYTGQDIVAEFFGSRGLTLLKNHFVVDRLIREKAERDEFLDGLLKLHPIDLRRLINPLMHLQIAKLDFERKFAEQLRGADSYLEDTGDEVVTYLTEENCVKVKLPKDARPSTDLLLSCYLLRRGYEIEEVMGDCIHIYTPSGSKRTVDDTGCDCIPYTMGKGENCAHMLFSAHYLRHRKVYLAGAEDFNKFMQASK